MIPLYESWFGPYFDEEFEIAQSYFGWNGNECSGMVLIDDRVMRLPSAGIRYLDHLVTHETCHQWFYNTVGTDGYAETFMDEGLVSCFTALRLDGQVKKFGQSALNMGLSRTEVIEAVIQTAPLSGFAPALNALGGLSEALGGA